jgi:ABC-type bacteriocin/lantibiotic exporter with double-glycine peptidase domain
MADNDEKLTPTKRFWRLLKPDQKEVTNIYTFAIFNGLVNLSLPLGIQAIVNLIQGGRMSASWVVLVIFVISGVAATGILQIAQLRITENLQQKIFTRAAFEFAFRMPRIKMEALYRHYAPELMNRFFDTLSIQKGLSKILIDFSTATLQVVFGLILLSFYHPFFIAFSLILVFLVFVIFRYTAGRGLKTSLQESKHKYQVAHWLEELARTNITFKLAGNTDLPLERTNEHTADYLKARESHFKILVRQYSMMVVFKVVVATGLLVMGGILVMEQQMNIGQFVAAEIIILLVMTSVEKLIVAMETIYDVLTSLEKVGQVTDLELEASQGVDMADKRRKTGLSIRLNDVYFKYPNHKNNAINGVSMDVEPGERIYITGSNESGKTTLLHLLAGLYDIDKGSISFDGLSTGNLRLSSLRSVIGDCLAQEQIFQGTVLENIAMGRDSVSFENVQWAVQNLGLENFITELPKGYDTPLFPEGKQLPKSAIQKILLARSIADKPRLLLLRDALQHLEYKDGKQIMNFLTSKENNWTLMIVSPDLRFAQKCNRVIIMDKGKITNSGTFEELKDILPKKDTPYA